jgi:cell division protein FtsL
MIGRTTLFWLALTVLVGIVLFHVKYQVMALEEDLARLNTATLREQNQIHVLEAEWSYLNSPSKLEEPAERLLHLQPSTSQQFTTVAELPLRPVIEPDMSDDPNRIAKMVPPRKPPVPLASTSSPRAPARIARPVDAGPAIAAAAQSPLASQPTIHSVQPLPAPVTPVGLAGETRPMRDR